MSRYHTCKDCIAYGMCDDVRAGQRDYVCKNWDWRYAGSWFNN